MIIYQVSQNHPEEPEEPSWSLKRWSSETVNVVTLFRISLLDFKLQLRFDTWVSEFPGWYKLKGLQGREHKNERQLH